VTIDLDAETSRFLQGPLAPVADELDVADLAVEGALPAGLSGTFLRNGPNPQFTPPGRYHPFDGDGMLHAVYLDDGQARYRNRWIESRGLLAERARGRAVYGGLSEFVVPDPEVVAEAGMIKNTANTHTVRHAGRWFGLMEACPPTEVSPELETLGEHDFGGALVGGMTAHPKVDPVDGELLFFGYSPFPPYLRYHRVAADGSLVQSVDIDLPAAVMVHDFAVTERYVVFLDSPARFDVQALMAGGPAMRWEPDSGTRIGVLPRNATSDEVRWFEIDTCYVVHFFNAWDDGTTVHVHAPAFDRMPGGFDFDDPRGGTEPFPTTWTIDLAAGTVRSARVDDRSGEFPRINDDVATRRHHYAYNCLPRSWEFDFDFHGVVKYDLDTGGDETWFYGATEVSGEHVFAPDPDGRAEDDGWLLSMVTDRDTGASWLSVLDARDVSAGPVAKVHLPRRVPLGFHANWFAA
jgi:carotenoid cleavage dioxygenase